MLGSHLFVRRRWLQNRTFCLAFESSQRGRLPDMRHVFFVYKIIVFKGNDFVNLSLY